MSAVELTVIPDEGVTERYAAASGDHNPIHLDAEFARSVGLPDRILHGLWTAAQVARAAVSVSDGPLLGSGKDTRYALAALKVQFRGMGRIGPELQISGSAAEPVDGEVAVKLDVTQAATRLVRGAQARVRLD